MSAATALQPGLPVVLGVGGTTRPSSSSELAVSMALNFARKYGAHTRLIGAADLNLPMYGPEHNRDPRVLALVTALREADGIIIASPCYHGGISGLLKNALDYAEIMRTDPIVYFDRKAIGVIGVGAGWQGPAAVVSQLRQIAHALRGLNVPLGVSINSAAVKFAEGTCNDATVVQKLEILSAQVVEFARVSAMRRTQATAA